MKMRGATKAIICFLSSAIFAVLDLLDCALCIFYRFLDSVLEANPIPCHCRSGGEEAGHKISETLYERRNIFRDQILGFVSEKGLGDDEEKEGKKKGGRRSPRWSDCSCESCVSWQNSPEKEKETLHLVIKEPKRETSQDGSFQTENVIFLHGFLSSSSIWVETVFPNLSDDAVQRVKMFAVDLLGFGKSPKPENCLYRIEDHLEKIERTVIKQFGLTSFHLVSHSMGCILALALAAKYPNSVKSITLIAPPYFPSIEAEASHNALNRLAERKIWPPSAFFSSVMSWYEHLGRTICFIICRNHLIWEWIIKLLTGKKHLAFQIRDITRHTHRSGWHTMHEVLCRGAKFMDNYLRTIQEEGIFMKMIHGDKDQTVPLECSYNIKLRVPKAELQIIKNADHSSVIIKRKKEFTMALEKSWLLNLSIDD
ncbi:probable lysophospholipase BODYGUARD 4 isoform X2 [Phalaenopsis equestris]|uniref:probable lysophospholipase BODYGUARD 4 isoform X2 n=1 Tax=Phalaenopsis equestris TaxID=78828 RepID=UPI0009E30C44|nr:probable lysophospholipase BODYGUARD 4 isoform X2 [Phalaenopsis equestris]